MKKIILAVFLIAGAATLHAQDSTKHKMQNRKMSSDSMKRMPGDTSMMHHKMKGKMKKDSMK